MNTFRWLIRTLWFSRWITLGIILTAAVATAVLAGSLLTGDSVHQSLRAQMHRRLGDIRLVLAGEDIFFRPELANPIAYEHEAKAAPVVMLSGWVENADATRRVNRVNVYGVDSSLAALVPGGQTAWIDELFSGPVINEALARRLDVAPGDAIVFAVRKQGGLAADSVLFPEQRLQDSRRMTVSAVAGEAELGPLSLYADTAAALNLFLPRQQLAQWIGQPDRANAILIGPGADPEQIKQTLQAAAEPADLALEVRRLDAQNQLEVRSRNVFMKDAVAQALMQADPSSVGVLSYFVNEIRKGDRSVPYSIVSAFGVAGDGPWNLYTLLADNEIILNEWTAADLRADAGDTVTLSYFVSSPTTRALEERSQTFTVRAVVPMMGTGADPTLMPDFPELADVENCTDWDPGIPIDLDKIRDKDEAYWDRWRGSPKAFVSLAAAQQMWASRFGSMTAVRYGADVDEQAVTQTLRNRVEPSDAGLSVLDVADRAQRSAAGMTDFGSLFAGLSMFLVLSAVILTGMIFYFGMERQTRPIGLLKAVGLTTGRIRAMYLVWGLVCAVAGALLGILIALAYTRLVLWALRSMWSDAVADASVEFFVCPGPLLIGAAIALASATVALFVSLRRLTRRPPHDLFSGSETLSAPPSLHKAAFIAGLVCLAAALGLVAWSLIAGQTGAAGIFFSAGSLFLLGFLLVGRHLLRKTALGSHARLRSVSSLSLRSTARRTGRSLAVVTVMACGVFMVTAVGLNEKSAPADPTNPSGPTGGFTLMAEAGIPVLQNLGDLAVQADLGLDEPALANAAIVPLRLREGEHAGCLNLNRASQPRLLGVNPETLKQRNAFAFQDTITPAESPWDLLNADLGPDVVPAIGDVGTVYWGLGLSVGDTLTQGDADGNPFQLQIVALMKSSVLQGSLLISEADFVERFESAPGYRFFLIAADPAQTDEAATLLTRQMRSKGMEVVSTSDRLNELNAVENTYLAIFLVLGGLGLLLGTAGLGLVVWLNVLDRRGELAMMRAVGFSRAQLMSMLEKEHLVLLLAAVVIGAVSALVSVIPALASLRSDTSLITLAVLLGAILLSGWLWIRLAARAALAGSTLDALRSE